MALYTQEAMTRPLFEEPEDIYREDPIVGPHGFVFDDMGISGPDNLAHEFFEAAHALTETINRGECEDYRIASPVLFLYRHAIELFLKSAMPRYRRIHKLDALADDFAAHIARERGIAVPGWVTNRIKEIEVADPRSLSSRYGRLGTGPAYVSLPHLQNAMFALVSALCELIGWPATESMEEVVRRYRPQHARIDFSRDQAPNRALFASLSEPPQIS